MESMVGVYMMGFAQLMRVLIQLILWVAVAILGTRLHPRASILVLSAGIIGAVLAMILPLVSWGATQLAINQLGMEGYYFVSAALNALHTFLYLIPWVLLLVGLARLGSLRDAHDPESRGERS